MFHLIHQPRSWWPRSSSRSHNKFRFRIFGFTLFVPFNCLLIWESIRKWAEDRQVRAFERQIISCKMVLFFLSIWFLLILLFIFVISVPKFSVFSLCPTNFVSFIWLFFWNAIHRWPIRFWVKRFIQLLFLLNFLAFLFDIFFLLFISVSSLSSIRSWWLPSLFSKYIFSPISDIGSITWLTVVTHNCTSVCFAPFGFIYSSLRLTFLTWLETKSRAMLFEAPRADT